MTNNFEKVFFLTARIIMLLLYLRLLAIVILSSADAVNETQHPDREELDLTESEYGNKNLKHVLYARNSVDGLPSRKCDELDRMKRDTATEEKTQKEGRSLIEKISPSKKQGSSIGKKPSKKERDSIQNDKIGSIEKKREPSVTSPDATTSKSNTKSKKNLAPASKKSNGRDVTKNQDLSTAKHNHQPNGADIPTAKNGKTKVLAKQKVLGQFMSEQNAQPNNNKVQLSKNENQAPVTKEQDLSKSIEKDQSVSQHVTNATMSGVAVPEVPQAKPNEAENSMTSKDKVDNMTVIKEQDSMVEKKTANSDGTVVKDKVSETMVGNSTEDSVISKDKVDNKTVIKDQDQMNDQKSAKFDGIIVKDKVSETMVRNSTEDSVTSKDKVNNKTVIKEQDSMVEKKTANSDGKVVKDNETTVGNSTEDSMTSKAVNMPNSTVIKEQDSMVDNKTANSDGKVVKDKVSETMVGNSTEDSMTSKNKIDNKTVIKDQDSMDDKKSAKSDGKVVKDKDSIAMIGNSTEDSITSKNKIDNKTVIKEQDSMVEKKTANSNGKVLKDKDSNAMVGNSTEDSMTSKDQVDNKTVIKDQDSTDENKTANSDGKGVKDKVSETVVGNSTEDSMTSKDNFDNKTVIRDQDLMDDKKSAKSDVKFVKDNETMVGNSTEAVPQSSAPLIVPNHEMESTKTDNKIDNEAEVKKQDGQVMKVNSTVANKSSNTMSNKDPNAIPNYEDGPIEELKLPDDLMDQYQEYDFDPGKSEDFDPVKLEDTHDRFLALACKTLKGTVKELLSGLEECLKLLPSDTSKKYVYKLEDREYFCDNGELLKKKASGDPIKNRAREIKDAEEFNAMPFDLKTLEMERKSKEQDEFPRMWRTFRTCILALNA